MRDAGHDQPDDQTLDDQRGDDTVEIRRDPSLVDDLLPPADTTELELEGGEQTAGSQPVDRREGLDRQDEDDEYFEPHTQRRSRVTTGLLVALIFALGMLCGVLAGRVLAPPSRPQIVYLLNDANTSTSTPAPPTPAPSASR